MVTLREYAAKWDISYEAVRRQVSRCSKELEGHIIMKGKVKYLDDDAVRILDSKRATNVVRVYDHDPENDQQIKEAEKQNTALMEKITEMSTSLNAQREKIEELKDIIIEKDNKIIELQNMIISMQQSSAVHPDERKEEEKTGTSSQEEPENAQNSSDTPQSVPDQEGTEAGEEESTPDLKEDEQKERVNIDTLSGTNTHDDTTHEREAVADPVHAVAVPEEKAVNESVPVPDQEQKKGLLHRIFSIWKR